MNPDAKPVIAPRPPHELGREIDNAPLTPALTMNPDGKPVVAPPHPSPLPIKGRGRRKRGGFRRIGRGEGAIAGLYVRDHGEGCLCLTAVFFGSALGVASAASFQDICLGRS
jgi:hypothetical protein